MQDILPLTKVTHTTVNQGVSNSMIASFRCVKMRLFQISGLAVRHLSLSVVAQTNTLGLDVLSVLMDYELFYILSFISTKYKAYFDDEVSSMRILK